MKKIRVALGLSGGVDSAVSAYLLKSYGYDVHCVYLNCFDSDIPGCRGDNDRKDALAVAMHLGLPFQVLDFRKEYQAAVIDYFKKEYLLGRTPNPDVICNRDIKFGLFLDWAIKAEFDAIATGHYARVSDTNPRIHANDTNGGNSRHSNGKFASFVSLFRPADEHKDQTYFLWAVPREKFERVLFPLGDLLKTEVREIALKIGLPVAKKKDSTGICFVGEVRVEDFLKRLGVKEREGEVVVRTYHSENSENSEDQSIRQSEDQRIRQSDNPTIRFSDAPILRQSECSECSDSAYRVIGSHRGVWFYTIGQRHGFEITNWPPVFSSLRGASRRATWQSSEAIRDKPVFYVIEKDIKKNRLIVGFGAETYRSQFVVSQTNWLISNFLPDFAWTKSRRAGKFQISNLPHVYVRLRHGGELIPCQIKMIGGHSLKIENCKLKIKLGAAQRGVAPGQSAVFYTKDGEVWGGGIISDY